MATVAMESNARRRPRVSWGGIIGGTVFALGVWLTLYALGLALGLSSINPNENIGGSALFTGIWSIIAPLVALFAGGYVAARLSGLTDKMAGSLHGAVLWGLTLLIGAFMVFNLLGAVVGGAASLGKTAISGAGGLMQQGQGGGLGQALGIQTNDLIQPLNQRLKAQGKPPVTAQQLSAAVQSAAQTSVRQGRLDSETFQSALAQNTNLTREDVREISGTLEQRINQGMGSVEQTAATAASSAGTVFWGMFFALLLGLVSAVLGALVGTAGFRKYERRQIEPVRRPVEVR